MRSDFMFSLCRRLNHFFWFFILIICVVADAQSCDPGYEEKTLGYTIFVFNKCFIQTINYGESGVSDSVGSPFTHLAGSKTLCFIDADGSDGVGTSAIFGRISSAVLIQNSAKLIVADRSAHKLRTVDCETGEVKTILYAYYDNAHNALDINGVGMSAGISYPNTLTFSTNPTGVYVSNNYNMRKVTYPGIEVSTVDFQNYIVDYRKYQSISSDGTFMIMTNELLGQVIKYNLTSNTRSILSTGRLSINSVYVCSDGKSNIARYANPRYSVINSMGSVVYISDSYNNLNIRKLVLATEMVSSLVGICPENNRQNSHNVQGMVLSPDESQLIFIECNNIVDYTGPKQCTLNRVNVITGVVNVINPSSGPSYDFSNVYNLVLKPRERGPCMLCEQGTYSLSGSKCNICPVGFFCGVTSLLQCPAGTYSATTGQTSNSTCQACLLGYYCPPGSSVSIQCPAGFYCSSPDTCVLCGNGMYCPQGSTQPSPCLAGSVCITPSTIRQCVAGTYCPQNSSIERLCRRGSYCQQGSVQEIPCPAGSVCSSPSTVQQCISGSYCPQESTIEQRCAVGFFCSNVTVQIPCPMGYFCDSGSTAPSPLNDGCVPPVVYLPFTSSLTENLGYGSGSINVHGNCAINPSICYGGGTCMSGIWIDGQKTSFIEFPVYVNASFSLAMWIFPYSGSNSIFSLYDGTVNDFYMLYQSGTGLYANLMLNPPASMTKSYFFEERTWIHISVSIEYSAGIYTGKTYFNGMEVDRLGMPGTALFNNNNQVFARIGKAREGWTGFGGGIAQFGLFNYVISTQQVYSIFKGNTASCKCPAGFYCNSTESPPTACPSGTYSTSVGKTSISTCQQCPLGYFCASTSDLPVQCELGFSCPAGSFSHSLCPTRFYCSSPSLRSECSTGSFCPPGSTADTPCLAGSYCPNTSTEIQCALTNYCPSNSTTESQCPAGSFCSSPSSIQLCTSGAFCPSGSVANTPCPEGNLCMSTISKVICPAGSFCAAGSWMTAALCPPPSVSHQGSIIFTNCSCPAGTFGRVLSASVSSCQVCLRGVFCTGDAIIQCSC